MTTIISIIKAILAIMLLAAAFTAFAYFTDDKVKAKLDDMATNAISNFRYGVTPDECKELYGRAAASGIAEGIALSYGYTKEAKEIEQRYDSLHRANEAKYKACNDMLDKYIEETWKKLQEACNKSQEACGAMIGRQIEKTWKALK